MCVWRSIFIQNGENIQPAYAESFGVASAPIRQRTDPPWRTPNVQVRQSIMLMLMLVLVLVLVLVLEIFEIPRLRSG